MGLQKPARLVLPVSYVNCICTIYFVAYGRGNQVLCAGDAMIRVAWPIRSESWNDKLLLIPMTLSATVQAAGVVALDMQQHL